ncbi:MAG: hypothetical protein EHM58_14990 [Ignavibacteriae bacterium]|nr:MAG: hypothetical protein EHM58_14990 [Ignavibacteriota bacterium]
MNKEPVSFTDKDFSPASFKEMEQTIDNINRYSTIQAQESFSGNNRVSKLGVFTSSFRIFAGTYITNKPKNKGLQRLVYSLSKSMVSFLTNLKLLKMQGRF